MPVSNPPSSKWMAKLSKVVFGCEQAQNETSTEPFLVVEGSTPSECKGGNVRQDAMACRIDRLGNYPRLPRNITSWFTTNTSPEWPNQVVTQRTATNSETRRFPEEIPGKMQKESRSAHLQVSALLLPVRPIGFEPITLGSEDRCAIQLRHGRKVL